MFLQGRVIIVWLTWLIAGICGVIILLVVICYCRLMPRHQKSFDEQYLKETYAIKENQEYAHSRDSYRVVKHAEVHAMRVARPASCAGDAESRASRPASCAGDAESRASRPASCAGDAESRVAPPARPPAPLQYASSGMLDELESGQAADALKTRSLPAFLRPKPRPLSTEDDLHQLYAKVSLSKKYKSRMRSEHAAIIALSKSHSQFLEADAVIVYDQRTAL